ncbi:hypothetical protein C0J52_16994 [Blattella germanica]|nr:hypothetical protein C0J52_16994 [Blattella germanica]
MGQGGIGELEDCANLIWNRSARPFMHMFDKYGPVVRLQGVFGGNIVFVSHPEHIETVFQHEGRYPVRSSLDSIDKYRSQYRNTQMLGPSIMSEPEWEVLRKTIEASFGNIAFQYHGKLENTADEMITRIRLIKNRQEEVPNSFSEDIYKWALENTALVLLGKRLGLLDSSENHQLSNWVKTALAYRSCIIAKYIRMVQNNLDNKKEDILTNKNAEYSSMLEMLLLKGELQPNDILTVLLDTFLIGVNAISHAFSFLLYHLAKNPWVQRKAFNEIIKVMPEKDSTLSYSSLLHLPYTQACLQESLR